ncbi:hexokinase A [Rhizoclosmatium hyalinum]|nr:hexokinase A [Rhizoclosmatium hyalinum]
MSDIPVLYAIAAVVVIVAGLALIAASFVYIKNSGSKAAAEQPVPLSSIKTDNAVAHALAARVSMRNLADDPNPATLLRLQHMFEVTGDKLSQISKHMMAEMKKGLASDDQTLKMIPTHVVRRPKGNETGSYLALDLGGTNFRVCEISLDGHGATRSRQSKHTVTDDLKSGSGEALFDFFAECVKNFLKNDGQHEYTDKEIESRSYKLGFTFSFAVNQVSINEGYLMLWNKGFSASDCIGKNVVVLLQDAFKRKRLNISVTALVNDTTGTLVSHAYTAPDTYVGVILGTGTNAAYVEKIENVVKFKSNGNAKDMIINTEWGAFDDEMVVIPRTKYDHKVDRGTAHYKTWTFEKLISGMYLGEIVRYVLADLVKTGEIFAAGGSKTLGVQYAFETAYMSRIERDHSLDLSDVRTVLEDLMHIPSTTLADRRLVRAICEMIGKRAARLSAAGIAAIVTKMNKLDGCTVGIDGSLFELYPHFSNRMRDALHEILGFSADNIVLEQARDGSGQGAALIAALANTLTE